MNGESVYCGDCECRNKLKSCSGHFGHIELGLPVFHIGYFKHILTLLQCICKRCSKILLKEDFRRDMLQKVRKPGLDSLVRARLLKKVVETCKKAKYCCDPKCNAPNGTVKKV